MDPDEPPWRLDREGRLYPSSKSLLDQAMSATCQVVLLEIGFEVEDVLRDFTGQRRYDEWTLVSFGHDAAIRLGCSIEHDRPDNDPVHPYNRDSHVTVTGLGSAGTTSTRREQKFRREDLAKACSWVIAPPVSEREREYTRIYGVGPDDRQLAAIQATGAVRRGSVSITISPPMGGYTP
jgi:hypothetical protein